MNDKLQAAHDKLQEAVAEIVSGDEWKRMLQVASKFHNYSFNNQLLIFLQRPGAPPWSLGSIVGSLSADL